MNPSIVKYLLSKYLLNVRGLCTPCFNHFGKMFNFSLLELSHLDSRDSNVTKVTEKKEGLIKGHVHKNLAATDGTRKILNN